MSANEAQDFTAAERAALDRISVPALRAGFAADIVSAAGAGASVPPRRWLAAGGTRRGWTRPGRTMLGVGALLLASATAAATGMLGKLPIAIPGITRAAEASAPKPKHVARVERPRPAEGRAQAIASATPVPDASPSPLPPLTPWQARRQERIALGLPVSNGPPPLVRRAIVARLGALPGDQRQAVASEWRRIKTLPPGERKAAIAQLKAGYLAAHPKVAARVEQRLEQRSAAAAASGQPMPVVPPGSGPALPRAPRLTPPIGAAPPPGLGNRPFGPRANPQLSPEERTQRRDALRQWREQRRQWRGQRPARGTAGGPAPVG